MPDKNFDRDMPHADITDLNRQSENGQGSIQWTFTTDHTVKEVLGKGFFHSGGRSGLQRLDFIEAWTEFRTISPVLIRLAVTKAVHGMPVEVVALGEPVEIATPEIPWWETELPKTKDESIQMILEGSWLDPADHERARNAIEPRFEDLFAASPDGYRPLWRKPMREVLVTWEPDAAVKS